jgi:hypothetical protein
MNATRRLFVILLVVLTACGCAGKKKQQAEVRRAYAAGQQSVRQMQQAQQPQMPPQSLQQPTDPLVRILGAVKNPILVWSDGLTLARALVESDYQKSTAPKAITIYRNNQPFTIDPQRVLEGDDYPLFPGDIVYIQD